VVIFDDGAFCDDALADVSSYDLVRRFDETRNQACTNALLFLLELELQLIGFIGVAAGEIGCAGHCIKKQAQQVVR